MPNLQGPHRILVLGSPGSGKTTAARSIAAELGLPLYHLDDEYWGPGWTRAEPERWRHTLRHLTAKDSWVIDGNYLPTVPMRAERADAVVLLHVPAVVCAVRVLTRALTIQRHRYEHLPARVRAEAVAGLRVRATRDLKPLLRKIARFPRTDWWRVLRLCWEARCPRIVVATAPGPFGTRRAIVRSKLRHRGLALPVVPPSEAVLGLRSCTGIDDEGPASRSERKEAT